MKALAAVDPKLEGVLDYGWFAPLSKLLLWLLNLLFGLLHNYGLAILALTLLVRLIMVPFTLMVNESEKSMWKRKKSSSILNKNISMIQSTHEGES